MNSFLGEEGSWLAAEAAAADAAAAVVDLAGDEATLADDADPKLESFEARRMLDLPPAAEAAGGSAADPL